jgi:hypothetical protein
MKTGAVIPSPVGGLRKSEHCVLGKTSAKFLWEIQGYMTVDAYASHCLEYICDI